MSGPAVQRMTAPDARVDALLARHHDLMRSQSPEESCHVMTSEALRASGAQVYFIEEGGGVLAVGALKAFGDAVELKSMHVAAEARGRGLARQLLAHLLAAARAGAARAVYLETGSMASFAAARGLYAGAGFRDCPPFGDYVEDPLSVFMVLDLEGG